MANDETRLTEELEKLLELRKGIENELEQFNKKMEGALGGDTRSMYFGPSHLFDDYLIKWIMRNLNEALITKPSEYVHMCFELNMKVNADANSGRK